MTKFPPALVAYRIALVVAVALLPPMSVMLVVMVCGPRVL